MKLDEELNKLEQQHQSGAISDEEYAKAIDKLVKPSLRDRLLVGASLPLLHLFFWKSSGIWGFFALVILLFVTAYQVAPGHELVKLTWRVEVYYVMVGVAGAIVGLLGGQRRVIAIVCGAVAAIASLWLIGLTHEHLPQFLPNRVWGWIGIVVLAVGLIPGVLLYAVCDWLLPPLADDQPGLGNGLGRCPNPACRSRRGWDGSACRYCGTHAEPLNDPGRL